MIPNEKVSIESLMLANHVESADGRLFISGGGWSILQRPVPQNGGPALSHLGVAVIVAVPWHQTNLQHKLTIELRDEDANTMASITAPITVGRPAGLRPGMRQYANVGLSMDTVFPHQGGFEIVARIEGSEGSVRRWTFQVQDIQQMAAHA